MILIVATLAQVQPKHPLLTLGTGKTPSQKKAEKRAKAGDKAGTGGGGGGIDRGIATAALKRIKENAVTPDAEKVMEETMRALDLDFQ